MMQSAKKYFGITLVTFLLMSHHVSIAQWNDSMVGISLEEHDIRGCVAVVGESVAYGSLVFEVPRFGFFVARTRPLSVVLQTELDAAGYDLEVHDYSVRASYLSPDGPLVYTTTPEYQALLEDRCAYVVIGVWMNDLTMREPGEGADEQVDLLADLIGALAFVRPDVQIGLVAYYHGQPAAFVPEYGGDIININVPLFNEAIFAACENGERGEQGRFQKLADVTCIDIDPVFAEMNNTHVVTDVGKDLFYSLLYEPVPAPASDSFRIYWEEEPAAVVHGDGMHLSEAGKVALVDTIIERFLAPAE